MTFVLFLMLITLFDSLIEKLNRNQQHDAALVSTHHGDETDAQ